jgi:hypothetical protein
LRPIIAPKEFTMTNVLYTVSAGILAAVAAAATTFVFATTVAPASVGADARPLTLISVPGAPGGPWSFPRRGMRHSVVIDGRPALVDEAVLRSRISTGAVRVVFPGTEVAWPAGGRRTSAYPPDWF